MSYIVILRKDQSGNPIDCREFETMKDARASYPTGEVWPSEMYNYVKRGRDILAHTSIAPKKSWWKFWK